MSERPSSKTTLFEFRGHRRVVLLAGCIVLATVVYQIAKLVLQ